MTWLKNVNRSDTAFLICLGQVATEVQAIQNQLPKARVVYCSATGVSEVGNMAFMTRLVR